LLFATPVYASLFRQVFVVKQAFCFDFLDLGWTAFFFEILIDLGHLGFMGVCFCSEVIYFFPAENNARILLPFEGGNSLLQTYLTPKPARVYETSLTTWTFLDNLINFDLQRCNPNTSLVHGLVSI